MKCLALPQSYFARRYSVTLQSSKVALLENEREISVFVFDNASDNELNTIKINPLRKNNFLLI